MVDELLAAPGGRLKALARAVLQAPDRLLYRTRFRAAHQVILSRPRPHTILVICYGNICRSPFAAHLLADLTRRLAIEVESAGFVGAGRRSPTEAVEAARQFDVDLATHRSHALTPRRVQAADLIITMDIRQATAVQRSFGPASPVLPLGDFDPQPGNARTIADPVNQPVAAFVACYTRIERCVRQLAATLRRGTSVRAR